MQNFLQKSGEKGAVEMGGVLVLMLGIGAEFLTSGKSFSRAGVRKNVSGARLAGAKELQVSGGVLPGMTLVNC